MLSLFARLIYSQKGYGKYSFETLCKENPSITLQDGRHTIFVNATGVTDDQNLQEFLDYLKDGTVSNSPFIRKLDKEVRNHSSNAKWKEEYNMLLAREEMLREEGVKKQKQEMYQAFSVMMKNGIPLEQILKAIGDPDDFKKWLSEHNVL